IRETKKMLAEGSDWFKEQTSAFYKEEEQQEDEEEREASLHTTTSPHVSINGVGHAPASGPSVSRAEQLIRSYGLDKPKPKPKYGIDSFPVQLSQQAVARSQIEPLDEAANSTVRKRKYDSSLLDPRFGPVRARDNAEEDAYIEISLKRSNHRARPKSNVSINNHNPYSHLQHDQDDDREEEELYEDTDELVEDEENDQDQDLRHYYYYTTKTTTNTGKGGAVGVG
ncbi:hypothetical protein DV737_g5128, partial [Chaetothyriales sp. CBS 132003]